MFMLIFGSSKAGFAPNMHSMWCDIWHDVQGIHKRMVRFKKLIKRLFLTLHGHKIHYEQRELSVSHGLPAARFSCLLLGRRTSFQDGVAAGEGFLCAQF
jgi:hypothetical protein